MVSEKVDDKQLDRFGLGLNDETDEVASEFSLSLDELEFTDIPILRECIILLFIGERGNGKSLVASYLAAKAVKNSGGKRKCYYFPASLNLSFGEPISLDELTTFAELDDEDVQSTKLDGSILLIDEIHVLMNKYRSSSWGNRIVQAFLSMMRKKGCDLIATTNSPQMLDEAFVDQIDYHAPCKKYNDKRCYERSKAAGIYPARHLKDCRDTVRFRLSDTKKKHGRSRKYADGVMRKWVTVHRIVNYYRTLYNTFAKVSSLEIASLSKAGIQEATETAKTGATYSDFMSLMRREIIPSLVEAGAEWIYPAPFVETLKEQWEIDASKERIGKACKDLGLEGKRGAQGSRYKLPDKDRLEYFVSGVG